MAASHTSLWSNDSQRFSRAQSLSCVSVRGSVRDFRLDADHMFVTTRNNLLCQLPLQSGLPPRGVVLASELSLLSGHQFYCLDRDADRLCCGLRSGEVRLWQQHATRPSATEDAGWELELAEGATWCSLQ
jgi:hypothetical protein